MGKIDWIAMFQALKDVGYDGVSRSNSRTCQACRAGRTHRRRASTVNPTATDEFVAETVAGMNYLKGICKDLGIPVD